MNKFLKQVFFLLALLSSINIIAQDNAFNQEKEPPFNPKFSIGSGIYTLTGDIQNEEDGFLKGQAGFNAGMRFGVSEKVDLSFLLVKTSFSANNNVENFSSDIDGFGLHLGYTLNPIFKQSKIMPILSLGVQRLSTSTVVLGEKIDRVSVFSIPLSLGFRMDVTERLQFDVAKNFFQIP